MGTARALVFPHVLRAQGIPVDELPREHVKVGKQHGPNHGLLAVKPVAVALTPEAEIAWREHWADAPQREPVLRLTPHSGNVATCRARRTAELLRERWQPLSRDEAARAIGCHRRLLKGVVGLEGIIAVPFGPGRTTVLCLDAPGFPRPRDS
jgi:hypothetical protein